MNRVTSQGTRTIKKGAPTEEEIKFFGLADYSETSVGNVGDAGGTAEEYEYDEEGGGKGQLMSVAFSKAAVNYFCRFSF